MPKKSKARPAKKPPKKKGALFSPKGMRDIFGEEYLEYQGFFEKASEVALYYGFAPIETPALEKEDVFTRTEKEGTDLIDKEMYRVKTKGADKLALRPEGTAPIMRAYIEHGWQSRPQPVMLYSYGTRFRHENPQHGRWREFRQFDIDMLGTAKSIGDAMVIKTLLVILEEAGFKNTRVQINSIGDKECRPAFVKELVAYYKKHAGAVCASCKQRIKNNPMRLLDCKELKCKPVKEGAPEPLSALCAECRSHFKEVLEYLETLKIPYEINGRLVRGLDYYTKTVFEVFGVSDADAAADEEKEGHGGESEEEGGEKSDPDPATEPLALGSGGRYDNLAKDLGNKKDVAAVGGSIGVDRVIMSAQRKRLQPRIIKKPKVYFIQLGFEAKLRSLAVIDILRKSRVPTKQALSKDGLSVQLRQAEKLEIPYVIIFGQKEALEESVIVRNMRTRSQETIKVKKLQEHLKKLK